ncbi:GPO family capsid scaffolding protein [Erwinia aphidicola]|uniref:GPO family capsid scaffolding protein n=1 Tax=Erwinia aphidicola TaxID=68334 RepID=UPI003019ED47
MVESRLSTGWICVASEGDTVDGRKIEPAWLTGMAATYDPAYYTALIWEEHDRSLGNLGEVLAVRAAIHDGMTRLYARLHPTSRLLAYNELGQKLFCSIEVEEDFAGQGGFYLGGLAVTDTPASIGTERLRFSANQRYFSRRGRRQLVSRPTVFNLKQGMNMAGKGWASAIAAG